VVAVVVAGGVVAAACGVVALACGVVAVAVVGGCAGGRNAARR
jgi:hypothetical protein